jgi:hypothetical protein
MSKSFVKQIFTKSIFASMNPTGSIQNLSRSLAALIQCEALVMVVHQKLYTKLICFTKKDSQPKHFLTFHLNWTGPWTYTTVALAIHGVVCQKSDFYGNSDIQNSQKLDPLLW